MKSKTKYFLQEKSCLVLTPNKMARYTLLFFLIFSFQFVHAQNAQKITITGTVQDSAGIGIPQVTVTERGTKNATKTLANGGFSIKVNNDDAVLVFTSIGYASKEVPVGSQTTLAVTMQQTNAGLGEVVVVGYGSRKRESITGAISSVTSKDIDRVHAGATVSTALAGKIPGVTFRQAEGRPGSSATVQIRNMGTPLYVIDGIQQDEGQFNNIAPNDIESITVLKDASAAIYGVRAANGVVVVTTKKGTTGRNNISVNAYNGWQSFFRFPKVVTSTYDYLYYKAEAEMNLKGSTSVTQAMLDAAKAGTDPQYRSFNWRDYVLNNNGAPLNSVNVNINGGSDKVNYYVSGTNLYQNSVLGKEYNFNRTNLQSNVTAKLANGLKAGFDINGRVETRKNPGVPGLDDYWLARLAVLRNTPMDRPFANDNPDYLNDLGDHLETNYAFLNSKLSGKYRSDWRVVQTNFHFDWDVAAIKGLTIRGLASYYYADELLNNQEYTYNAYTYNPVDSSYAVTGGSTNPWREREQIKNINTNIQLQATYNNTFGKNTINATVVTERIKEHHLRNWLHASPQSNYLTLINFPIMDRYDDEDWTHARIGYIGRINYSYGNRYFLEASARRDASYLFAPGYRVGYFPGFSAGWRITQEPFWKAMLGESRVISDIKFRGSYGILGDDSPNNTPIVDQYAYLPGYNYGMPAVIFNGSAVITSRDKGPIYTNITWLKSKITDIGMDFSLFEGKLTGTFDWFYRKRTGLLGGKNDVLVPVEIGYILAQENINSDAQYGEEGSLNYVTKFGKVNFNVGGNLSFTRSKFLHSYNPVFFNSYDQYRNSGEERFTNIGWGYISIGQFTSQEQINNYKVDIDGQGNRTLLPGDLIYQDVNGDGKINGLDQRPIGFGYGNQPNINFGLTFGASYKDFDFHADFSGASGYTWYQNWEQRWAFQNNGNLNTIFEDRWHHENPFDLNSPWIPGKYPANRYNPGTSFSDYGTQSTFWLHNVTSFRARTIEIGYSLSQKLLSRAKIQRARIYLNAYNLFSIDNLRQYGLDPETIDDNGLQFPQNRVINVGINLSL